jgi:Flp pilus assembly protein TadG
MDRPLIRQIRQRRRGDAIVEFALLAPMLVMILFGSVELGRVVDAWLVVHNAAREGARAGAAAYLGQDPATLAQSAATSYLSSGLAGRTDLAGTSVQPPVVNADDVTVTAEVQVQLYTPMFQAMFGSPVRVRATADMRRQ